MWPVHIKGCVIDAFVALVYLQGYKSNQNLFGIWYLLSKRIKIKLDTYQKM